MNDYQDNGRTLKTYQRFCRAVLLPLGDRVFGQRVSSRFKELLDFQWKSEEEIACYRHSQLRDLLRFCNNRVPYYREVFRDADLSVEALAEFTEKELAQLPILTKQHLRERFSDLKTTGFRGPVTTMMSSGSTGAQTATLVDKSCFDEVYATQLLFWSWGHFFMGARHLQTGMSLKRGFLRTLKDRLFLCNYVSAFGLQDADLNRIVNLLRRRKIRAVFGYASSIYVIASFLKRQGVVLPMDSIFTWGDSLFPHYRELVEEVFSCRVNDCYGLGEGIQCAAQCEHHDALHEAMNGVITEIVDPKGQPCDYGELGRVIVTRLVPGAMPLIRYDTGDMAYFVEGKCDCNRNLRRISRIQGRSTDIVTTPGGDRLIVHFFTQIFEVVKEIRQFQVRQNEPESILVSYIPGDGFSLGVLEKIRSSILGKCTYPLKIQFQQVDEIPLEKSNKRRFVISKVPLQ